VDEVVTVLDSHLDWLTSHGELDPYSAADRLVAGVSGT
jgi:hypothetical protein